MELIDCYPRLVEPNPLLVAVSTGQQRHKACHVTDVFLRELLYVTHGSVLAFKRQFLPRRRGA